MRGEDFPFCLAGRLSPGSPPHARGRLSFLSCWEAFSRITPACAGKTSSSGGTGTAFADHPRMRGEDSRYVNNQSRGHGSPPHARGRRNQSKNQSGLFRITPACAGKTRRTPRRRARRSDHPRMRGEDGRCHEWFSFVRGSPPHARGRLWSRRAWRTGKRITPACAGKTRSFFETICFQPDHPRMRGEDRPDASRWVAALGSPPHARGRLRQYLLHIYSYSDHPRMRGEDAGEARGWAGLGGSPPHARGRREAELVVALAQRITPACAGKTCLARLGRVRAGDHPRMRGEDSLYSALDIHGAGSPPHARGRHAH